MNYYSGVWILLVASVISRQCISWPEPESLIAFWPLDAESGLNDIANGRHIAPYSFQLMTQIVGPFGKPNTSLTVKEDDQRWIGERRDFPELPSFTISLYFFTHSISKTNNSGIFCTSGNDGASLQVNYGAPDFFEIGKYEMTGSFGRVKSVIPPKKWTFLAITYNETTRRLAVFDKNGVEHARFFQTIQPITRIVLGYAASFQYSNPNLYMKTTDAISCVMLYSVELQPNQIAQLPFQCETKGTGLTTTTQATTKLPLPWPRPESVLAFWPINSQYQFNDISKIRFQLSESAAGNLQNGPFGDEFTAATPKKPNVAIFQVSNQKIMSIDGSFTVAMFFLKGQYGKSGGIFEFQDKHKSSFQFRYENETTIEVSANEATIGHYTMIQPQGAWTFVAMSFDASTTLFTVYGRHGVVAQGQPQPEIAKSVGFNNNNGIRLGYASRWKEGLKMADAVSCLMIYSTTLTKTEVRQIYEACRIIHGSAPCGAPRLPLSPIPSTTKMTTTPQPGQFPFVASLRFGKEPICSATILDAFWLVTSSQCFIKSADPKLYSIYVGEHDLALEESYTKIHPVSKIFISGDNVREIALIHVGNPIDFSNNYVNDVCLYREENAADLNFGAEQFVFGWGENGRQPLASRSLPRYVVGYLTMKQQQEDIFFNTTSGVPCSGDEGSPLLVQGNAKPMLGTSDRLIQLGVFYKRDPDCSSVNPSLFTNIANYNDWISEKMACVVPGYYYPEKCPQV